MDFNFLKNPIILAVIAAVLTYLYMYWENEKKIKKNPKADVEQISFVTPIIVGILTLFITYSFFGAQNSDVVGNVIHQTKQDGGVKLIDGNTFSHKSRISERLTDAFDSNTYHLVGKNAIKLPQTDVFIDIAKF